MRLLRESCHLFCPTNLLNSAEFTAMIRRQKEQLQEWVLAIEANKIEQVFLELNWLIKLKKG